MSKALPLRLKSKIEGGDRQAVSVSQTEMVRTRFLEAGGTLPLVVEPAVEGGVDLLAWARGNRETLAGHLARHGGVLFRGFGIEEISQCERLVEAISHQALEYNERSSPRSSMGGHIYSSTDYPPDQTIFLHNENSYQQVFPLKIFFFCVIPSESGGETPIADCRRVYERIDPRIRARFINEGWMYVRNFGDGFGLPWQTVFQTSEPAVVEDYCREHGIEVEWKEGGRLRTRALRPAVARHPTTGELTWFNHATIFHVTTLAPHVRDALLAEFSEEDLPSNSYYGSGASIEPEVLDHLREVYRRETVSFPWQKGDVLMLDNMLVAHGRAPFTGERKIAVGMAEPISWDQIDRLEQDA
jgi:alpha-ketoglutarate-dependent taurine dioxygenase